MTLRPPRVPITEEIYRQLPEGPPYYQLIEGNLIMSPSPNRYHQKISIRLSRILEAYLEDNPLGEVYAAPSDVYINKSNIYQPDLYYVSNENHSVLIKEGARGAPDLVIEILSPSNFEDDRDAKRKIYARARVREMWIVDPEERQIEVYSFHAKPNIKAVVFREPALFAPSMFPGLQIDTAKLFKPLT